MNSAWPIGFDETVATRRLSITQMIGGCEGGGALVHDRGTWVAFA